MVNFQLAACRNNYIDAPSQGFLTRIFALVKGIEGLQSVTFIACCYNLAGVMVLSWNQGMGAREMIGKYLEVLVEGRRAMGGSRRRFEGFGEELGEEEVLRRVQ
jgi:hypothetical protein